MAFDVFDIDGDDLSFTLTAGQAALFTTLDGSTLTINPTDPDLWGEFDITITANDGEVDSTPVTFTLSIPDTNQGPTGTPTAVLTNGIEDTPTVVSEAQLLEGLTDPEGDAMQITSMMELWVREERVPRPRADVEFEREQHHEAGFTGAVLVFDGEQAVEHSRE